MTQRRRDLREENTDFNKLAVKAEEKAMAAEEHEKSADGAVVGRSVLVSSARAIRLTRHI